MAHTLALGRTGCRVEAPEAGDEHRVEPAGPARPAPHLTPRSRPQPPSARRIASGLRGRRSAAMASTPRPRSPRCCSSPTLGSESRPPRLRKTPISCGPAKEPRPPPWPLPHVPAHRPTSSAAPPTAASSAPPTALAPPPRPRPPPWMFQPSLAPPPRSRPPSGLLLGPAHRPGSSSVPLPRTGSLYKKPGMLAQAWNPSTRGARDRKLARASCLPA